MKNEFVKKREKEVFEYLDKVRIEEGKSWAEIIRGLNDLGYSVNRNAPNDWKKGKSNTFMQYIGEICEMLEISADSISIINNSGNMINGSSNSTINAENSLSKQEKEIIDIYRNLSIDEQFKFIKFALELKNGKE